MKRFIALTLLITATTAMNCKKKQYAPPKIKSNNGITASSVLSKNMDKYGPKNLIDKTELSWCEGRKDDGIGSKITINLSKISSIESLFIKNGFGKPKYYAMNNRVKDLRIHGENEKIKYTLKDSPVLQEVKLKEPLIGKKIVIEVLSVYKGSKYPDTCMAEISFKEIKFELKNKNTEMMENIAGSWYEIFQGAPTGYHRVKLNPDGTFSYHLHREYDATGKWESDPGSNVISLSGTAFHISDKDGSEVEEPFSGDINYNNIKGTIELTSYCNDIESRSVTMQKAKEEDVIY